MHCIDVIPAVRKETFTSPQQTKYYYISNSEWQIEADHSLQRLHFLAAYDGHGTRHTTKGTLKHVKTSKKLNNRLGMSALFCLTLCRFFLLVNFVATFPSGVFDCRIKFAPFVQPCAPFQAFLAKKVD